MALLFGFIQRAMKNTTSFSCSPGERQGAAEGSGAREKYVDLKKIKNWLQFFNSLSACCFRGGFSNMIQPSFCINILFSHLEKKKKELFTATKGVKSSGTLRSSSTRKRNNCIISPVSTLLSCVGAHCVLSCSDIYRVSVITADSCTQMTWRRRLLLSDFFILNQVHTDGSR